MSSSASPSAPGQAVTFTASVYSSGMYYNFGGAPTGTVNFYDGETFLGAATLTSGNGMGVHATLPMSGLALGSHPITADNRTHQPAHAGRPPCLRVIPFRKIGVGATPTGRYKPPFPTGVWFDDGVEGAAGVAGAMRGGQGGTQCRLVRCSTAS